MSLAIDIDTVEQVLIGNTWYPILKESFAIDAYEFLDVWWNEVPKFISLYKPKMAPDYTGCRFSTIVDAHAKVIYAPMSSIQAVVVSEKLIKAKEEQMEKQKQGWIKQSPTENTAGR